MDNNGFMSDLKRRILHQLIAWSCGDDGDYGLYSGNGGIMLVLFEQSRQQMNKPLNHYAMGLLEKGMCLLQKGDLLRTPAMPDPLLIGWIIAEGHRREYFDADMEENMPVFDDLMLQRVRSLRTKDSAAGSDLPVLVSFMISRYRSLYGKEDTRARQVLDCLDSVVRNITDGYGCGLAGNWIIYGMLVENKICHGISSEYLDWLPGFTMEKIRAGECGTEELYLIWRISGFYDNDTGIEGLRTCLQTRLACIDGMPLEHKVRLLEKWGVTRYFFYPDSIMDDPYWDACIKTVDAPILDNLMNKRVAGGNFSANEGLCSLLTIL